MRKAATILVNLFLVSLTACTQQPVKEDQTVSLPTLDDSATSEQLPPLTEVKDGKTLNIVKIMDGAACKNDYQGVKGTFLVYANPIDIERIKQEKSTAVFAEFENKIQALAGEALQQATEATNLAEDPFALGPDQARENLANQLSENFQKAIEIELKKFVKATTLTIDIHPFPPSLSFFQTGCDTSELEQGIEQPPPK